MGQNDFNDDLDTFFDRLLEPSEAFARIFQNAYVDAMMLTGKQFEIKATFEDVAQVSGALTSLTRLRLQQLAGCLQEKVGEVEVLIPRRDMIVVDYEIDGVEVKTKQPQSPCQRCEEMLETIETETERVKRQTAEIKRDTEQRKKKIQELLDNDPEFKKKQ